MMRAKFAEFAGAASDTASIHALLIWLDTLPPEVLIAAEGRRRAELDGVISGMIPEFRPQDDDSSTVDLQIESDVKLARMYWEHPNMIYTGIPE